jgi:syntaxin 16
VVQSIHSLNAIYKELQNLVIEQGSLLDRIDENIDHTVESVKEATKHLEEVRIELLRRTRKARVPASPNYGSS